MIKQEKIKYYEEALRTCRPKPRFDLLENRDRGLNFVLGYLYHNQDKTILAGDIAKELGASTARIAVLIKRLESKGLITKSSCIDDKRKAEVKLSKKGIKEVSNFINNVYKNTELLIKEIGEDDLNKYIEVANKMKKIIENSKEL